MAKTAVKTIKGFPDYSVSTNGEVFSSKFGEPKQIKGSVWMGYQKVGIANGAKKKTIAVHRLVAETFLPKPRGFNVVNHIDGDKSNNKVSNLEWTNHRGNSKHYGEKLAPKYKLTREKMKKDSMNAKLSVLDFAYTQFKDSPDSFVKVYEALR